MKTHHLIVNPTAGRGRARQALPYVRQHLERHGITLQTHVTQAPRHATDITRSLPPDATVLSLGGDGTLHEVAAGCINTQRTVGVLPAGSGDDFAYAIGIRRHSLEHALHVITQGQVRKADTATVNGISFINSLGIGFDAEVAHAVHHSPSIFKGQAAYLYGVITTLSKLENPSVRVEVDDQLFYDGPALLVTTQNGPSTGGGFLFSPKASVFDGQLDILVAGNLSRLGTLNILPKVMRGNHLGRPNIFLTRGTRVRLEWKKARPGHMEGELLDAAETFEIGVLPHSLQVFACEAK
jgi:diacylglycerol kinase (ATP)